ncbi:MAG: hypothetical protein ACYTGN_10885 [Planctomycetota bacterium]|jgi:protocatechuate 3,4-dioxygenase beta subunit
MTRLIPILLLAACAPTTFLRIDVSGPTGEPAAGARVTLKPREGEALVVTAGADGVATLSGLEPNTFYWLDATHPELGNLESRRVGTPPARPGELALRMPAGVTTKGTAVDAVTGEPVRGVRVGLGKEFLYPVEADDEGRFAFRGWSQVLSDRLLVRAPGYVTGEIAPAGADAGKVLLQRGNRITGRLVDERGATVPDALLAVRGTLGASYETTSDAEGRFVFGATVTGGGNTLTVLDSSRSRRQLDFDPPATEPGELDLGNIVLLDGQTITGVVRHADGGPAANVPVQLDGTDARRRERKPARQGALVNLRERVRTDANGRFEFARMAPGLYKIQAQPRTAKLEEATVNWREGAPPEAQLTLKDDRGVVVRVVEGDGRPVWGATLLVRTADGWTMSAETSLDGTLTFRSDTPIASVEQAMCFEKRFLNHGPIAVEAGAKEVTIRMERCVKTTVVVRAPDGSPYPLATLRFTRDGKGLIQPLTMGAEWQVGDTGRAEVYAPVEGVTDIELWAMPQGNDAPLMGRAQATAGQKEVVVQLEYARGDGELSVVVLDPDGNPLPGAQVYASLDGRFVPGANALTNADGVARLAALPPRPLTIFAKPLGRDGPQAWMKAFAQSVRAEGQELQLRIERPLVVQGVVLDGDGKPVAGVYVMAQDASGMPVMKMSDGQGRFRFELRPSQSRNLWVYAQQLNKAGERWYAEQRTIPSDGSDIELKLAPR